MSQFSGSVFGIFDSFKVVSYRKESKVSSSGIFAGGNLSVDLFNKTYRRRDFDRLSIGHELLMCYSFNQHLFTHKLPIGNYINWGY